MKHSIGSFLLPALAGGFTWYALQSNTAEYILPFMAATAVYMFFQAEKKAEADKQEIQDALWKLRHLMKND